LNGKSQCFQCKTWLRWLFTFLTTSVIVSINTKANGKKCGRSEVIPNVDLIPFPLSTHLSLNRIDPKDTSLYKPFAIIKILQSLMAVFALQGPL
jgi:hypothetical protein